MYSTSQETANNKDQKKSKEGDVTLQKSKDNSKTINKDIGDYVDYEEVKD